MLKVSMPVKELYFV